MAATPDGKGYWLVASDGGIFNFGDAAFYGSTGGRRSTSPSSAWRPPPTARVTGWSPPTAASSTTATRSFQGSTGGTPLNKPIVGMAVSGISGPASKLVFSHSRTGRVGADAFSTSLSSRSKTRREPGHDGQFDVTHRDRCGTPTSGRSRDIVVDARPRARRTGSSRSAAARSIRRAVGYKLTATDGQLASATSAPFDVGTGTAAQLAFTTTEPENAIGGSAFVTQPVVTIEDAGGNTVTPTPQPSRWASIGLRRPVGLAATTTAAWRASAGAPSTRRATTRFGHRLRRRLDHDKQSVQRRHRRRRPTRLHHAARGTPPVGPHSVPSPWSPLRTPVATR